MVSYGHLSGRRLLESPDVDGFVSPFEYVPAERAVTSPLGSNSCENEPRSQPPRPSNEASV